MEVDERGKMGRLEETGMGEDGMGDGRWEQAKRQDRSGREEERQPPQAGVGERKRWKWMRGGESMGERGIWESERGRQVWARHWGG